MFDNYTLEFGKPFVTTKEWHTLLEIEPNVEWTHIGLTISFKHDVNSWIERQHWIIENIKNPVFDSTYYDYFFYEKSDAMLFKLWLKI